MAKIHHFQRYTAKENVHTNNALRLMSQLYLASPELLEALLAELVEGSDIEIGPIFRQQIREGGGVPDAVMDQRSMRILIETKRSNDVGLSQLERHLKAFDDEDTKVLLVLTGREVGTNMREKLDEAIKQFNQDRRRPVVVAWVTFQDLIETVRLVVGDRHYELQELIEDFQEYCGESGLLPRQRYRLRAVPCGDSYSENMRFALYYEPPGRSATPYDYLGIYRNKAIRGIGRVAKRVQVDLHGDDLEVVAGEAPNEEEAQRIRATIEAAQEARGWDLTKGHHFVLLDDFAETRFSKTSKGGMPGHRYFDLGRILGVEELPPVKEIAEQLRQIEWE